MANLTKVLRLKREVQELEQELDDAKDAMRKADKAAELKRRRVPVTLKELKREFGQHMRRESLRANPNSVWSSSRPVDQRAAARRRATLPLVRDAFNEIVEHVLAGGRVYVWSSRMHESIAPGMKRYRATYLWEVTGFSRFYTGEASLRVVHRRPEDETRLSGTYNDYPSSMAGWLIEPDAEFELR